MAILRFAVISLVCTLSLMAQPALDNETVLKLFKAGLSEEVILGMVNNQPGKYSMSADDVIALKSAGVSDKVIAAMVNKNSGATPIADVKPNTGASLLPAVVPDLILHDATPVRLRLSRNLSSADAKVGDNVDFEVLDDVKVDDVMVIPRGATAIATITKAEHKKRMARGGKLDVNIDYVRVANEKIALRAVKETSGGGHTGAMTGGMVATAIVFFPAAPFFLFMHGKDTTIPKGTEITAYVNGEIKLDREKFKVAK